MNLAFIPTQHLNRYYKAILHWIGENSVQYLSTFISYFVYTYFNIYDKNENIEQKCIFSASSWNAYERVLKNIPRTTHSVEGWHRAFNANN